ncbi:Oidioi.mRNA.OKI2018_I69.PAR.g10596.t1.cds [Oikopleura dioica]|uniref:Oidioi.mRNA.OKI2018_I69.PAR.g10596.t1.cds n=1 Tax=Oikopleura dioica TaxID=34765 RepID=A0ABN7RVF6_OIKDI|nr:Oidioi.mRNA.OKI2018_I69.PAR.g10596.t1.cds [Oikopleura dioica]
MNARAILKGVTITSGLWVGAVCYYKAEEIEKKLEIFKANFVSEFDVNLSQNELGKEIETIADEVRAFFNDFLSESKQKIYDKIVTSTHEPETWNFIISTLKQSAFGLQKLAKLAIFKKPDDCFVEEIRKLCPETSYDLQELLEYFDEILSNSRFGDDCLADHISALRKRRMESKKPMSKVEQDELDIGKPTYSYKNVTPEKVLEEYLDLTRDLLDSSDFLAKQYLINSGVIDRLLDLSRIAEEFHKRAFEILASLSTVIEFRWDLLKPKLIFESILTLASSDVEQKSFAYKILHNVSSSSQEKMILPNSFLAYPTEEALPTNASIVFVHGLMGKAHRTWRCNDKIIGDPVHSYCWPVEWLPKTLARRGIVPKIILMSYPTSLTTYNKTCLHMDEIMDEKSEKLLENLKSLRENNEPLFIVGHSMGGLLLKKIMLKAHENNETDLLKNIKGVCFYSTPHFGSSLAKLSVKAPVANSIVSSEVRELSSASEQLKELNDQFLSVARNTSIPIHSFIESVPIKVVGFNHLVVSKESADLGLGGSTLVNENHINVNKPSSKSDILYSQLVNFIVDNLHNSTDSVKK